ncbi:FAD-dependent oxidoreductase [Polynucleobacter sp.]|uniref:FAD-dependent oxidoreductase n=1 Tax=Polynucleobacter sp. TaxID=2029855 RepID=UPI0037CA6B6F
MKVKNKGSVCVIGAGIIGATTAYALSKEGWSVTVVDSNQEAGMGASFANGAQLSYSYVEPLATPETLKKIPVWLLSRSSPIRWLPQFNWRHILWLAQFISYCNASKVKRTTKELLRISHITQMNLDSWLRDLSIAGADVSLEKTGKLVVYREASELAAVNKQIKLQKEFGCHQEIFTAEQCVEKEPSLSRIKQDIAFGVYTQSEEAVDCHALSKQILKRSDVHEIYMAEVLDFIVEGEKIKSVNTSQGEIVADQFVIAAGNDANTLLRKINRSLLIEPIKGYSVSFPIVNMDLAPNGSITDQNRKVVFARIGTTLRVAGFAEIVGRNLKLDKARIDSLVAEAERVFPGAIDPKNFSSWTGMRPASPSGVPYIENIGHKNLWVNAGHGSLGLTLSVGSAVLLVRKIEESVESRPFSIS